jgi:hypothetical protein
MDRNIEENIYELEDEAKPFINLVNFMVSLKQRSK